MANLNAKFSIPSGRITSKGNVTKVASEAIATAASATTIGIRIGDNTGLTPALCVKAAKDAIEVLLARVSKFGLTAYQQVSGVAKNGKPGLTVNTTTSLATDTHVGVYINLGAGVSASSTMHIREALMACLNAYRESVAAS